MIDEPKSFQTSDKFISLFNMLEQRYQNKRIIVNCHIKNILNLYVIKFESTKNFCNFLDNIKKNIRALNVLKFDNHIF